MTTAIDTLGLPAILQPFRPRLSGWRQWPADTSGFRQAKPYVIERWYHRGQEVQVLSSIERVDPEDGQDPRLEYHVSVSGLRYGAAHPYCCSSSRARWALKQFRFDGSLEDNHVPGGIVRNYWRPVDDRLAGQICACVDEEPVIREMKGDYIWRGHK